MFIDFLMCFSQFDRIDDEKMLRSNNFDAKISKIIKIYIESSHDITSSR